MEEQDIEPFLALVRKRKPLMVMIDEPPSSYPIWLSKSTPATQGNSRLEASHLSSKARLLEECARMNRKLRVIAVADQDFWTMDRRMSILFDFIMEELLNEGADERDLKAQSAVLSAIASGVVLTEASHACRGRELADRIFTNLTDADDESVIMGEADYTAELVQVARNSGIKTSVMNPSIYASRINDSLMERASVSSHAVLHPNITESLTKLAALMPAMQGDWERTLARNMVESFFETHGLVPVMRTHDVVNILEYWSYRNYHRLFLSQLDSGAISSREFIERLSRLPKAAESPSSWPLHRMETR